MTDNTNDTNPFRYCGEYFDAETGFVYLRNRYYDPSLGRFISEDPHWNVSNMIYGDKQYKEDEIKIPDMSAIMQNNNLYIYCISNPIQYKDPSGKNKTIDLGSGWSYRIDNGQNGQQHIHVDGPNGQSYSRNADGTKHDGSEDTPPKWVRKKIDEKLGKKGPWKWDVGDSNNNNRNSNNSSNTNSDNKSSSKNISNNSKVSKAVSKGVGIGLGLYTAYQFCKWAIATMAAPYTGGSSYVIAGAMP